MQNPAIDQVTISAVVVMVVQWLKTTKLNPFMSAHTDTINRVVAWGGAAATALGLHLAYDSTSHVVSFVLPTLAVVLHATWDWIKSIAVQELIYKGVLKPGSIPGVPAAPAPPAA